MSDKKDFEDDFIEIMIDGKVEYINVEAYQMGEVDFKGRKKKEFDKTGYKTDKQMSKTPNVVVKGVLDGTIFQVLDEDIQSPSDFFSKL